MAVSSNRRTDFDVPVNIVLDLSELLPKNPSGLGRGKWIGGAVI